MLQQYFAENEPDTTLVMPNKDKTERKTKLALQKKLKVRNSIIKFMENTLEMARR